MNTLIAIDTETGGFNPRTRPLLSLAAVADDGALFNIKVKPRRVWWRLWRRMKVEAQAAAVNGYTPEAWEEAGAVEIDEAAERFQDWIACRKKERGGRVQVVAHNAGFDRGFVEEMERVTGIGLGLGHHWECSLATLAFLRRVGVFHERGACSLDALCLLAGVTRQEPHDALSDALACFEGYRFMQAVVSEKKWEVRS